MPDTGNTYTWPANSFNPAVTSTPISSSDWNANSADSAAALTDRPKYATAQANAYRFGGIAGGTANALTASLTPAVTAYGNGLSLVVYSGASANTGDTTLAVNGLAATQVLFYGVALRAYDIQPNTLYKFVYYNSKWNLLKFGPAAFAGGWKNILGANGGGEIAQRGAGGTASFAVAASTTAYTFDRWYIATNANQASVVSQQPGLVAASRFCMRVQRNSGQTGTSTVTFGFPLDTDEVIAIRDKKIAMRAVLRAGANWSPTSGVLTMRVAFGTGAAAKRITGFTSETVLAAPDFNITTTAAVFSSANATTVPTNATQGEVQFTWTPVGTAGAADYFEIDDVDVRGDEPVIDQFERRPFDDELRACKRHFEKTFEYQTAPGQGVTAAGDTHWRNTATGAVFTAYQVRFEVEKRAIPTITTMSIVSANAEVRNGTDAADCSGTAASSVRAKTFLIGCTGNAGAAVNENFEVQWTADAGI